MLKCYAESLLNNSRALGIVSAFNIYFTGVIISHGFRTPALLTSELNQVN